ncbi:MAG: helix-turn-helix domain-containing protein [Candidatus Berkiella sp.]
MSKHIKAMPTPDLNQNFSPALLGRAVKARRTQSQLRIEDAAALCGVAKQTLMDVEHGQGKSQISTIMQICSGLGIKLCIMPWISDDEANNDWE